MVSVEFFKTRFRVFWSLWKKNSSNCSKELLLHSSIVMHFVMLWLKEYKYTSQFIKKKLNSFLKNPFFYPNRRTIYIFTWRICYYYLFMISFDSFYHVTRSIFADQKSQKLKQWMRHCFVLLTNSPKKKLFFSFIKKQ